MTLIKNRMRIKTANRVEKFVNGKIMIPAKIGNSTKDVEFIVFSNLEQECTLAPDLPFLLPECDQQAGDKNHIKKSSVVRIT